MGRTLFDKIWDEHVVADLGDGFALLHVDRHFITDAGSKALMEMRRRGLAMRNPELAFASPDHSVSTTPGRGDLNANSIRLVGNLRQEAAARGIRLFDMGSGSQGILHVIGPELGLTLPGALVVCADSHSCTHGGLGALGFGIGASEFVHIGATQTLVQQRPRTLRIRFDGQAAPGVTAKDLILHTVGVIGASGGTGYAVEYAGEAIRALDVEARLTLCNLSIELGAKFGLVAPDEKTLAYVRGRPYAPAGRDWDAAVDHWRTLYSDTDAAFDREVVIDAGLVVPQITWGTSPEQVIGVDAAIPDPAQLDGDRQQAARAALDYMGLEPGQPIAGTPIDWVFIGSCTNSRLSDLRAAAAVARGRKVARHVQAWVVPGSEGVKRAAEAEGLDHIFRDAGFQWREPGCSMCVAANGETVGPRLRAVSTSNRNFAGRQGPLARTHLASPAMAAAAAITGTICDVRSLQEPA
ncbi:MAG: 3-isopropylmalate dehydratase large subunit [Pigmentiphaga sp.]|uniref:3-isopropylmalate dehydratase large subunit n=1 Tax=Pigmentiphaga sp. TaxID=1977564 RepID=UPI0029B5FC2A|nr:3-isopropylmalate dehydratase large subunit [Pigmentiphaga sp.]MDX3906394.1 3-isopropylmalate dehydratase large subunit [Pigmentiphaga sp.]